MLTSNPEGSWMLRLLVPHDLQALRMQHQHVVMITTIKATSSSTKWLEPTAAVARLPTGRWVPDSCTPSTTNDLSVQEKWKGVVLEPKCQGPHTLPTLPPKHDCMFRTQLVTSCSFQQPKLTATHTTSYPFIFRPTKPAASQRHLHRSSVGPCKRRTAPSPEGRAPQGHAPPHASLATCVSV